MPAASLLLLLLLQLSSTSSRRMAAFPMREIGDFRSYRDATLLHFHMPEQVQTAAWNFTSWERKIYGISSCEPRPVNVYLKHGSYPVVSLDDSAFPDNYYQRNDTIHELHFTSNKVANFITLTTPTPGDWFAVVFNNYTDPDDDPIQQSGLVLVCVALLESNVDVILVETMNVIVPEQKINKRLDTAHKLEKFKFFVPGNTSLVSVKLTGLENTVTKTGNGVVVKMETSAVVSGDTALSVECGVAGSCEASFPPPSEHEWMYVTVAMNASAATSVDFGLELNFVKAITSECKASATPENGTYPTCWVNVPLTRQTYTGFFTYGFDQTPYENGTEIPSLDVSVKFPTLMNFEVNPIQDIGGTLSFEMNMDMDSVKAHLTEFQVILLVCVSHKLRLMPQFPDQCVSSSGLVFPNQLQVNSSSEGSKTNVKRLHIPFPEYGQWYMTLKPFCYTGDDASPLETSCGHLASINVSFIAESLPCGPDNCGQYGRCITQMDGGILFSSCSCMYGYRGWGCTDDSKVAPQYEHLIAALLLTLSNLVFIPTIVVAIRRGFYTESFVYACTMFFSTFYHACNAGDGEYSLCIFNLGVLQFCDFYLAIMAVWVTIIAMAAIPCPLRSLAHMAGAVFIASGTEYNRTSLWVFLFPIIIGISIMTTSWILRYRRTRACYPHKSYWMYYFPPGMALILLGLVCFSFLQTQRNYKYVHSAWHSIMALAVLLVLPGADKSNVARDVTADELEEIRSESQSPTDSTSWKWNTLCNRWCFRKK